jgi:hypothetical protein
VLTFAKPSRAYKRDFPRYNLRSHKNLDKAGRRVSGCDTNCLLSGPTEVENPGTLPSIRFGHPSADKNSDLFAVSNDNTALRKSEGTMGALIRRTNWVGVPRGCDGTCVAGDRYGS